jgi:signal transduction histidine kinase
MSLQKDKILYIDDEPENLTSFKFVFRKHYDVFLASSAMEGMEILKKEDVQLIITDQRMPKMTGVEFLEWTTKDFPEVIRMILTGYSDIEAIIYAINKGEVYRYITKPWDKDEMKMTIDNALKTYHLKRENQSLFAQLEESNKVLNEKIQEMDTFLYRSSHDFRRPLTTFMGLYQLAKLQISDPITIELFTQVNNTAIVMDKMLHKLMQLHEINREDLSLEMTDIQELLNRINAHFNSILREKNIKFITNINSHSTLINSYPTILEILLENLVENAIHFSLPRNGESFVEVVVNLEANNMFSFKIIDNGCGIEKEVIPQIFDMYYRGNESSQGNGLGLYVVSKAIQKLKAKSELITTVGKGTSFNFWLKNGEEA